MPLSKGVELIKKMSTEQDPKASIIEKQVKLLHQISKLEQLIDNAVHALVKEFNGRRIPTYQEEMEGKSSTTQEKEIETIYNLTTNPILEEKLPTISKEIQEVID